LRRIERQVLPRTGLVACVRAAERSTKERTLVDAVVGIAREHSCKVAQRIAATPSGRTELASEHSDRTAHPDVRERAVENRQSIRFLAERHERLDAAQERFGSEPTVWELLVVLVEEIERSTRVPVLAQFLPRRAEKMRFDRIARTLGYARAI